MTHVTVVNGGIKGVNIGNLLEERVEELNESNNKVLNIYESKDSDGCQNFIIVYNDNISDRKWIPVEEKLPPESGFYLVTGKNTIWICEYLILRGASIGGWCNNVNQPIVEAWLPLPKPYTK